MSELKNRSEVAVPLQGRYDGFPGQPGGPAVPPKDHIIWSLCCFVYSNPLCLGLAALIFSIKARDRKVAGDLEGARLYASTAHCLNIWATVLVSIGLSPGLFLCFMLMAEFITLYTFLLKSLSRQ
uniref:Uncharacterized protein n=1 Tax=Sparus aurata TaxID=8175 RepID=A0A671UCC2_SPAAU